MKMKRILILGALLLMMAPAMKAQSLKADISADIVSRYVWRGMSLGDVSLQPTLGISAWGLSLSAWGNMGLSNPADAKEIDLTLAYTLGGFNIGVTDYWVTGGPDWENRYFRYTGGATNHVFEATVGYDFGPLAIRWFTNFAGNDALRADGRPAFSSYAELSIPFSLGGADWTFAAGVVPFATQYYEAERFALTNLSLTASVDIPLWSGFSLPLFATLAANPHTRDAFFVVGITLRP